MLKTQVIEYIWLDADQQFRSKVKVNQSDDIDKSNLIKVEEDQFIEEFLPQVVCSNSNCEVVDKQGNAKGYISNKELQESLSNS